MLPEKQQISGWKVSTNGQIKKIILKTLNVYHFKNWELVFCKAYKRDG